MSKVINTHVFGITITWDGVDCENATIQSGMKVDTSPECDLFNVGVDAIEAMILAHFCSGLDVTDARYLEGIETAYFALANNVEI